MKKTLLWLLLVYPLSAISQEKGISFEKSLTLEEIKAKAKRENKFIFLDCYATWCGPCKRMDKEVYVNESVGKFFNERFISVKVQTDQTENDNQRIKDWYTDAVMIVKTYRIRSLPTYIFLSPTGELTHQETGFKSPEGLIAVGLRATAPGTVYKNPYEKYDELVTKWKHGTVQFDDLPYMVFTAQKIGDTALLRLLVKEYKERMKLIPEKEVYTKIHIECIASIIGRSTSQFFPVFFNHGKKVDRLMNKKNYARNVVDKIIVAEHVEPFLDIKSSEMMVSNGIVKKSPTPDWGILHEIIAQKYNSDYARRNVLEAKIIWNRYQGNLAYTKFFVLKWKRYGIESSEQSDLRLNSVAWLIFNRINDRNQIATAIDWMQGVVERSEAINPGWNAACLDTYAGLLYKAGKRKRAIQLQQKAVHIANLANDDPDAIAELEGRLKQMKIDKLILDPNALF